MRNRAEAIEQSRPLPELAEVNLYGTREGLRKNWPCVVVYGVWCAVMVVYSVW
jgi:hypothetical protein